MIWVVNTAIALGLTAILYRTLTRKNGASGESAVDRRRLNAAIYQERLEEVESDLARGAISEASFEQMKADLQETFVKDVEREEREKSNETALPPFYLKALLLVLPSIMLALYFFMAYNPPLRDWNRAKVQIQPLIDQMLAGENIDHEALKAFELSTFVRVLQSHLQVHPEKREGWTLLSSIFRENQMLEPAYQAARKAFELAPDRKASVIDYADLIIMKSGNRLTAESEAVINGYLVKEADPTLLAMKAGAAFHAERYQVALAAWQQLLAMSDSGMGEGPVSGDPHAREQAEKGRRFLEQSMALAKRKIAEQAQGEDQQSPLTALAHPAGMGRPQVREVAPGALAYHIEIELAESLVAPLDRALLDSNADLPLFVFIKATSGPPMPLAVKKLTLGEQGAAAFPMNVVLTQEDSMVPSLRLQDFKTVDVIARLSKSGQPVARPGDWQGRLTNVDQMKSGSSAMPLKLVVSEKVD